MKKNIKTQTEKMALLGLGKDNLALLTLLDKHKAQFEITICDFRDKDKLPKIELKNIKVKYQLGQNFNQNLFNFDILMRSPGWPLKCPGIEEAKKNKKDIQISSALNFFLQTCPSKNIIGVTGTKGKGTTSTLIYKILKNAYHKTRQVYLGGNIGISPISFLEKIKANDFIVLELSSFQLEDLSISPKIAVFTNLFKEHLVPADPNNPNYHKTLEKYFQAKLKITQGNDNKYLVANESLREKLEQEKLNTKIIYFTKSSLPSKLSGTYNQENIAAAIEVAKLLKIKSEVYKKVVKNFKNLEHRLELVSEENGVRYFDNSFSTTPESTILDLKSFSENIILIAGGADKGANFKDLAKEIKNQVEFLILLPGKGSDKLELELKKINFKLERLNKVKDMEVAVKLAKKTAQEKQIVLLSTACASFGIFKNYKERGDLFKHYVKSE